MANLPTMDWQSPNIAETFTLFKQRLELYFVVKHTPDEEKVPTLLLSSGEEGLKRYNSWTLTNAQGQDVSTIFNKFTEQLEPAENFRICRLKLYQQKISAKTR